MERAGIEILRLHIHRKRVALIIEIDIEICNKHIATLHKLRLGTQKQVVGVGVHSEVKR